MNAVKVLVNGIERLASLDTDGNFQIDDIAGTFDVAAARTGVYSVIVDDTQFTVNVQSDANGTHRATTREATFDVSIVDPRRLARGGAGLSAAGPQTITAPMPGKVVEVKVAVGDAVNEGEGVIVIEAMKMQNELKALKDGTVISLSVETGDSVSAGSALVVIE